MGHSHTAHGTICVASICLIVTILRDNKLVTVCAILSAVLVGSTEGDVRVLIHYYWAVCFMMSVCTDSTV